MRARVLLTGFLGVVLFAAGAFLAGGRSTDAATAVKLQAACPVTGEQIDKSVYEDHEGKRVYFCCADCKGAFKADPARYIQKMEAEGITVARLQTECPVMGNKIDKAVYVDRGGKRVYFCCPGCESRLTDKRIAELEAQGIVFESAPVKP
jgi:YHS domain-containing protein